MAGTILMEHITHSFQHKEVLSDVTLAIEEGEVFGLLGPSGAGKTTMINILTGQLKQTAGIARLGEKDTRLMFGDYYKKIGLMCDNMGLYERLTCYDNLLLIAKLYDIERRKVMETLDQVGLKKDAKKPVNRLSKGMRQRLLFARAIINAPSFLFLDEPTSGLDPANADILHTIIRCQQEKGTTVFMTTHNMEEASKVCNRIGLLHEGRIVEYGFPTDICNRYNHLNQFKLLLKDGRKVMVANTTAGADVICGYMKDELITSIHSTEPNLESVFFQLTGKGLDR